MKKPYSPPQIQTLYAKNYEGIDWRPGAQVAFAKGVQDFKDRWAKMGKPTDGQMETLMRFINKKGKGNV